MKKVTFKNIYICQNCKKRIVGYTTKCPICKGVVQKSEKDKIVTFEKRN